MQWIVQSTNKILVVSIIWKKQSLILLEVFSHTQITHVFASKLKWVDVYLYDREGHFDIPWKRKHCTFAVTTVILIHIVKKRWAHSQECFMLSRDTRPREFYVFAWI
jgi:hypothetical protein